MTIRATTAIAATVVAVLATGTSCSGPSPAAAKSSPAHQAAASPSATQADSAFLSLYLNVLRAAAADTSTKPQFPHFTPAASSDAKLIAAAHEACTGLQANATPAVIALLKQKGWTDLEAQEITLGATKTADLCPGQFPKVLAWERSSGGLKPGG